MVLFGFALDLSKVAKTVKTPRPKDILLRWSKKPSQKGTLGGWPWASVTRMMPRLDSTRRILQEWEPRRKTSPAELSIAQSSLTVPTKVSSGSRTTR